MQIDILQIARRTIELEARSIHGLAALLDSGFEKAIQAKDEAEAKENLNTVNTVLEQFAGKGVACVEE